MIMRDPRLEFASEQARTTFKYLWRELSWEYRRIIPGLDLSLVKVSFTTPQTDDAMPPEEFMWLSQLEFDGRKISGILANSPHWATDVKEGDTVTVALEDICDWMYVFNGKAYGGYTVNAIRSTMNEMERQAHDEAWGIDFGDPAVIELTPYEVDDAEHPMSVNMAEEIEKILQQQPELASVKDESGWTLLQREALAGNVTPARLLVAFGADPHEPNQDGLTAVDLAARMGWESVLTVLTSSDS